MVRPQTRRLSWRHAVLGGVVFGSLALLLMQSPIEQPQGYHNFADQRAFLGIPNFWDVVTNLPFLLVGTTGVVLCWRKDVGPLSPAWIVLFAGLTLVSIGSAYYHWAPTDETLVWDRLPMTLGFMGLLAALLGEFISIRLGKLILVPAMMLGFLSVLYWHWYDDLRFYVWVQFAPFLLIIALVLLFRSRYTGQSLLLLALGCYVLAKILELFDPEVFAITGNLLSGHSIKHLVAAIGAFVVLWMLKHRRTIEGQSQRSMPPTDNGLSG